MTVTRFFPALSLALCLAPCLFFGTSARAQTVRASAETYPLASPRQAPVSPAPTSPPGMDRIPVPAARTAAAPKGPDPSLATPPEPLYDVRMGDRTVREALTRWARASGWAHEAEHWALDRDHPIVAAAGPELFGNDFRQAVRTLLASTELTDRPVQPCFYSNRVLRVVPRAQACDPGAAH